MTGVQTCALPIYLRADAQRTLTDVRAQVDEEVASARLGLRDSAGEIARIVAQKILGRPA